SAVGVSAPMEMLPVTTPCRPASSVTTRVTVKLPLLWKSWVVSGVVVVFVGSPSPKSQVYVRIVRPVAGRLLDALKLTFSPTRGACGDVVNAAVGALPTPTSRLFEVETERPTESAIVNLTT